MPASTQAIVLSGIRYGDTSLIVKVYTREFGLQTYMVRGVLSRRKGKVKAGHFQPLTQLEITGSVPPSGKMGHLRDAAIAYPYATLQSDIRKSSLALFLSEVLAQAIREESPNHALFEYLESALQWLDHQEHVANFHLRFLLGLTRYLGFYPDQTDNGAPYFDLVEGAFTHRLPLNPVLSGEVLADFNIILGTNFDELHGVKMTQKRRRALLKALVQYFQIHLHGFKEPRSLGVLDEVFS